jgi:3'(2'), 5'-bisphosphate nucleotidase
MMQEQLELARRVAANAGALLLRLRSEAGHIAPEDRAALRALRAKADADAQALIVEQLTLAPGQKMLSEEGDDDLSRLAADQVWIVDPLDGTWEYGQNRSDWAVHIALYETATGRMLLGVVELAAQGLTRTSGDADPVLTPVPEDRPIRVVASRTRAPADLAGICKRLARRLGRGVEVVFVGSVGAKVNEILSGRAEAYLHDTGFREWDLAAPLAVAHHYGLVCNHWDGSDVVFNKEDVVVPDVFVSHPDIADALRESLH